MAVYLRPDRLDDALTALAGAPLTVLAGGTDFYPARVGRPLDDDILDITRLSALRGITEDDGYIRIGALTSWAQLVAAPLPPCFEGLVLAAREIGGPQIQNAGTVAGNLCNASPAADGVPPLLSLDASVELRSARGLRRLALAEFITGNRKTGRAADELVTAILVPKPRHPAAATFHKLGARRYLVISIVMVAAAVQRAPDGTVASAGIAVGSCSAVATRLRALEEFLVGQPITPHLGGHVIADHLAVLTPIDDIRGSADYRNDAALTLVRRALDHVGATL